MPGPAPATGAAYPPTYPREGWYGPLGPPLSPLALHQYRLRLIDIERRIEFLSEARSEYSIVLPIITTSVGGGAALLGAVGLGLSAEGDTNPVLTGLFFGGGALLAGGLIWLHSRRPGWRYYTALMKPLKLERKALKRYLAHFQPEVSVGARAARLSLRF